MFHKKKSTVLGLAAGAVALAAIPSAGQAANVYTASLNVDNIGAKVGACVTEQDTGTGEWPSDFTLISNHPPLALTGTSFLLVLSEEQGGAPSTYQLCTAANVVTQINTIKQTGNEASSGSIPGAGQSGFPMIDIGCSDVVMVAIDAAGTPHLVLLDDYSLTADIRAVLNQFPAANIPTATQVAFLAREPANADSSDVWIRSSWSMSDASGARTVQMLLQDFGVAPAGSLYGCTASVGPISDAIWVGAPAIPPGAAFGLLGVLIAAGGLTLARRRGTRSMAN